MLNLPKPDQRCGGRDGVRVLLGRTPSDSRIMSDSGSGTGTASHWQTPSGDVW